MGDQTLLEPVCRHVKNQALVDNTYAIIDGNRICRNRVIPTVIIFFQVTLVVFALIAFGSATHDIAADGFYMLALNKRQQSFFVGIRSTFYRFATLAGQGFLIVLAGILEKITGQTVISWSITFFLLAGIFFLLFAYHRFSLPTPTIDTVQKQQANQVLKTFWNTFVGFFKKQNMGIILLFLMLYRLGEALLVKMASPFLLDPHEVGGLGLSTEQVGYVYGTVGVISLTLGGILGGVAVAKGGLKRWLWPMALCITLPNIIYVFFAFLMPHELQWIYAGVAIEQFGYGFGFTAYMLYMMRIAEGSQQTAHYAICTGFMALGMMLPGMVAGWLQEQMGYPLFFVLVMLCTIPTLAIIPFVKRSIHQ